VSGHESRPPLVVDRSTYPPRRPGGEVRAGRSGNVANPLSGGPRHELVLGAMHRIAGGCTRREAVQRSNPCPPRLRADARCRSGPARKPGRPRRYRIPSPSKPTAGGTRRRGGPVGVASGAGGRVAATAPVLNRAYAGV